MSKKKNTLKDLDEFLKQQAAVLVAPESLKTEEPQEKESAHVTHELKLENIVRDLKLLSVQEGKDYQDQLYDFIIQAAESNRASEVESTMLINTALYLKHPDNWKDVIRAYWKMRKR